MTKVPTMRWVGTLMTESALNQEGDLQTSKPTVGPRTYVKALTSWWATPPEHPTKNVTGQTCCSGSKSPRTTIR